MAAPASTQLSSSTVSLPPPGTAAEQDRGAAYGEHRDGQRPQVERVLADLADDHEDEDGVDHVHVDVHDVSVPPGSPA
jgi:hypothetical protein